MKINEDYKVKLKVLNIMKDSLGAFIMKEDSLKNSLTKIQCIKTDTGEEYEVNIGQYLLSLDYSIRSMEREVMKMKQKSARIKMLKSLLLW